MTPLSELAWTQFWQVTVVAAGIGMVTKLFCRRRPHLAHMLWLVVLVKCLTPPIWSSPTSVFSWATQRAAATGAVETVSIPGTEVGPKSTTPMREQELVTYGEVASTASAANIETGSPAASSVPAVTPRSDFPQERLRVTMVLLAIWLSGAAVYGGFVLLATIRWWRTFRMCRVPAAETLATSAVNLSRRLGIRGNVRLWISRDPLGPLTFGWLRPTIVIPEALAAHRSIDELEPLLAHELIHVRRGDALVGMLQVAVQCLWWFHPLIWWANRRIIVERERCCDEEVVAGLACPPASYARTLLEVLEMKRQLRWPAAVPGARRFEITRRRLERIMVDSSRFQKRMPRGYWLVLLVGTLVLIPGAGLSGSGDRTVATETEQTQSGVADDQKASAAALMQAVYDSFAWVDKARTFRIRSECKYTNTDANLRWQETHRSPYSDGKPYSKRFRMDTELAWNEKSVLHCSHSYRENRTDFSRQTEIWNGTLAFAHSESDAKDREQPYLLSNKSSRVFNVQSVACMAQYSWGPGNNNNFWWLPTDVAKNREWFGITPQDFESIGQEEVNGSKCHVLESKAGHLLVYIGVADGRLYRRTCFGHNGNPIGHKRNPTGFDRLAFMRKVAGPAIKTTGHWQAWLGSLEPAQWRRAHRELQIAEFAFMCPRFQQTFDDYREVAPGCWMPFRQSTDFYNLEAPESFLSQRSEQIVTEVSVNQPIDEKLFRIELEEGIKVNDDRYDPLISYTYRKDQTEAERVALCEEAKKERAKEEEKQLGVIRSRMGKAPPALPQTGWINGGPLSWEQLQGKTVVVHFFWDATQGPSGELATLAFWHENSPGVLVVAIHPPTSDLEAVRKCLEESGATFPVLIDSPSKTDGGKGLLHDSFGSSHWVPTVLVNKRGLIAGYGHMNYIGTIPDHGHWFQMGTIPVQLRRLAAEK